MKVVVTIPTYQEAASIEGLVEGLLAVDSAVEVLVVDDDSPDGTWRLVAARAAADPRVHLAHRTSRRGRGHAGRAGFLWALEHGADVVVEMDADGSHDPADLPVLLAALADADVAIGSRLVPGGRDVGRSWWRVLVTTVSCRLVRLVLRVPVRDANSGYRAFWARSLRALDVSAVSSPGPAIVHEILARARAAGLRMVEVPITFRERSAGASSLTWGTLLRSLVSLVRMRRLSRPGVRPVEDAPPAPAPPTPSRPERPAVTADASRGKARSGTGA